MLARWLMALLYQLALGTENLVLIWTRQALQVQPLPRGLQTAETEGVGYKNQATQRPHHVGADPRVRPPADGLRLGR